MSADTLSTALVKGGLSPVLANQIETAIAAGGPGGPGGPTVDLESALTQGQSLVIERAIDGFPSIRIAAHEYDASYWGFVPGPLTSPTNEWDLVDAAPDCSFAARNLENYFKEWRGKAARPSVARFGQGYFRFDAIEFEQNADVFYQGSGLVIQGAGKNTTFLCASVSSRADFISLKGLSNWNFTPTVRDVTILGQRAANPYQVGVFINPEPVPGLGGPTLAFGGVTSANWRDVSIRKFARQQLWFRGGTFNYNVPIQYGVWDRIQLAGRDAAYEELRMDGQVGPPWTMRDLEMGANLGYLTDVLCYVGLDERAGLPIVDVTVDRILFAEPHRFKTGDPIAFERVGGGTWAGLTLGTTYYVKVVDAFRLKVGLTGPNVLDPPQVYVTLSPTSGVSVTGRSAAQVSVSIPPAQVLFDNFNTNEFKTAIKVRGGAIVNIVNAHAEVGENYCDAQGGAVVNITSGTFQEVTRSPSHVGFKTDALSRIRLGDGVSLAGWLGKLAESVDNTEGVSFPPKGFLGSFYPTIGAGVTNQLSKWYFQIGNAAEINLLQRQDGDYIMNTGATVYQHVRWQAEGGARAFCRVWDGGSPFAEIGSSGNFLLVNMATNGGTIRLPIGAHLEIACTTINSGVTIVSLTMPVHTGSWVMGTGTLAAGARITTTVACPGARVGDLNPSVSISAVLPAGALLSAAVTALDTVTLTVTNTNLPTGGTFAAPTGGG